MNFSIFAFLLMLCSADLIGFNRLGNNLHNHKLKRVGGQSVDDVLFQILQFSPNTYSQLFSTRKMKKTRSNHEKKNLQKFRRYTKNMRHYD